MKEPVYKHLKLSWQEVLSGYAMGIFPMGESDGTISWYESNPRAIVPIEFPTSKLNIPRSLKQVLSKNVYEIKFDTEFELVMRYCANRESTWINELIISAYTDLYRKGYGHSVEAWKGGKLVGGLYGVAYKGAFFGESMFHMESNASKVAVVKLYEMLKKNNFILFDIQMMTPLFESFGAIEISKRGYMDILDRAMEVKREFNHHPQSF